jgi:hypothetical protein
LLTGIGIYAKNDNYTNIRSDSNSIIENYPEIKDPFMAMLEKYMSTSYEARLEREMGPLYEWHKQLQRILGRDRILCLMPESEIQY